MNLKIIALSLLITASSFAMEPVQDEKEYTPFILEADPVFNVSIIAEKYRYAGPRFVYVAKFNFATEQIGSARFYHNTEMQCGEIGSLQIQQKQRGKQYGSLLYAVVIRKLLDLGCTEIAFHASPLDLLENQDTSVMLPALIRFYSQLGAQVTNHCNTVTAQMAITDLEKARQGIQDIRTKFYQKYS